MLWAVICVVSVGGVAQIAKKTPKSTGPRALGLVEVLTNGKTRLQAVCIMVGGKFFDAGTYKATPLPMALGSETVYEGIRTGISQGLFTVTDARKVRGNWFAEGRWVAAGDELRRTVPVVNKPADDDAPPILRRAGSETAKVPEVKPGDGKAVDAKTAEKAPAEQSGDSLKGKDAAATSEKTPLAPAARSQEDRPTLRRSKPGDVPQKFEDKDFAATAPVKDRFLAVSDAAGPDPHPFLMTLKPDEILSYNKKVLEMATQAVVALYPTSSGTASSAHARKPATPVLKFIDVQMRVFDLANSNDPVIVLTATVDPSEKIAATAGKLTVTVLARVDIYGGLRKLLAEATDDHHLDLYPRLEFLDAIDVDGDASGELVFRENLDGAQGFVVYRAGLDRVWPLFDSLRNY